MYAHLVFRTAILKIMFVCNVQEIVKFVRIRIFVSLALKGSLYLPRTNVKFVRFTVQVVCNSLQQYVLAARLVFNSLILNVSIVLQIA